MSVSLMHTNGTTLLLVRCRDTTQHTLSPHFSPPFSLALSGTIRFVSLLGSSSPSHPRKSTRHDINIAQDKLEGMELMQTTINHEACGLPYTQSSSLATAKTVTRRTDTPCKPSQATPPLPLQRLESKYYHQLNIVDLRLSLQVSADPPIHPPAKICSILCGRGAKGVPERPKPGLKKHRRGPRQSPQHANAQGAFFAAEFVFQPPFLDTPDLDAYLLRISRHPYLRP